MARTVESMERAARLASDKQRGLKRPAPKPQRKTPKREKASSATTRCARPCCWKTVTGIRCTCAKKGLKGRCATKTTTKKRVKRPLIARTNQVMPGITSPLYPEGVRLGAAKQLGIVSSKPTRLPVGATINLPPRKRTQTARQIAYLNQKPKARAKKPPPPKTTSGRKVKIPARFL